MLLPRPAACGVQMPNAVLLMRFVPDSHICWLHIQVRKQQFGKAGCIPSMNAIRRAFPVLALQRLDGMKGG
jgi:hypothetical protein